MKYPAKSKWVSWLFCVLALALCLPVPAHAHTRPDLDSKGSVTISYEFPGAGFYLYRVGELSQDVSFSLSGEFTEYPVSLEDLDSDGWREAAQTLAAYAARDSRTVWAEGTTDAEGRLVFSDLKAGLYLVMGDLLEKDHVTYEPVSTLVSLPDLNADDTWNLNPVISPKYEKQEKETVTCKVTKRWEDTGNKNRRPSSVTAQLLRDGEVYEEVKLKKENQWTHTWKDLEKGYVWKVAEKTTNKSYTVKVKKSGMNFVITNTYRKKTDEPTEKPAETPINPGGSQTGGGTSGGGVEGKLPQTGQLWWPVPYLALAGLVMICLGILQRKRES